MIKKILSKFFNKKPPEKIERIMFIKLGAIGDILMTTPLLRSVKEGFPNAKIDYYCGKSYYKILEGNKNIDKLLAFDEQIFFNKDLKKINNLKERIKKEEYDVGFVLDKHWSLSTFLSSCNVKYRLGFDRNGEGYANNYRVSYGEKEETEKHEIEYYLALGGAFNLNQENKQMEIVIKQKSLQFANDLFKKEKIQKMKTIVVFPGGANNPGVNDDPIRRWPSEKFAELINKIKKKYSIIIMGGKTDIKLCKEIFEKVNYKEEDKKKVTNSVSDILYGGLYIRKKIINLTGETTLNESAAVMNMCKTIICNDSGPMHIASAVNDSIISIFGPTNPKRKAPIHKRSKYIWKDEDIYDESYELTGKKPNNELKFMTKISVEDVYKLIN